MENQGLSGSMEDYKILTKLLEAGQKDLKEDLKELRESIASIQTLAKDVSLLSQQLLEQGKKIEDAATRRANCPIEHVITDVEWLKWYIRGLVVSVFAMIWKVFFKD